MLFLDLYTHSFISFSVVQFSTMPGYIYPALLTALVPVRSYILSRFFSEQDMKHLDPFGETEEDYHEGQRLFHHHRSESFDSDEQFFPNRAEFRGQGLAQEIARHKRHYTDGMVDTNVELTREDTMAVTEHSDSVDLEDLTFPDRAGFHP